MSTSAVEKCWSCHQMHERPGYCPDEFRFQKHRGYKEESCPYCNPKAVTAPPRKTLDGRTHYEGCEKIHPDCAKTPPAAKTPEGFEEMQMAWLHWAFPQEVSARPHWSASERNQEAFYSGWLAATARAARIAEENAHLSIGGEECSCDTCLIIREIAAAIRGEKK